MRILFIGDIVGKPGERIITKAVPALRERNRLDLVIVNAENAEDGSGLKVAAYKRLCAAGVDAFTLGDHIYKKREIMSVLEEKDNIVKPANFPPEAPGKEFVVVKAGNGILGRTARLSCAALIALKGVIGIARVIPDFKGFLSK